MAVTRRNFTLGALATLSMAGITAYLTPFLKQRKLERPNIILFLADDMRYDAMGFTGNPDIQTPNLDKLAECSVFFENGYVTTSICPASRASIYSGDYAFRHGVFDFRHSMRKRSSKKTFFRHLRKEGYYTGFIGKWGVSGALPKKQFDKWMGWKGQGRYGSPKHHLTDRQTENAIRFIKEAPADKPFLLIIAYKAPHGPYVPQERYRSLYEKPLHRDPSNTIEGVEALPPLIRNFYFRNKSDDDLKDILKKDSKFTAAQTKKIKNYYRLITGLDDSVGKVISYLEKHGLADDTSLIFTSDNGMMMGAHSLIGKWYMFEESIRVPYMIAPARNFFPHVKPRRESAMALNIDIAPTICAMAVARAPRGQGMSLMDVIRNPSHDTRKGLYYEFIGIGNQPNCFGYRTPEWKYIHFVKKWTQGYIYDDCLYDMKKDPLELHNLAGDPRYRGQLAMMKEKMHAELKRLKAI